jgi:hypothetical protein
VRASKTRGSGFVNERLVFNQDINVRLALFTPNASTGKHVLDPVQPLIDA